MNPIGPRSVGPLFHARLVRKAPDEHGALPYNADMKRTRSAIAALLCAALTLSSLPSEALAVQLEGPLGPRTSGGSPIVSAPQIPGHSLPTLPQTELPVAAILSADAAAAGASAAVAGAAATAPAASAQAEIAQ